VVTKKGMFSGLLIASLLRALLEKAGTASQPVSGAAAGCCELLMGSHMLPLAGGLAPWKLKWEHSKACNASSRLDKSSLKSVLGWWSSVK